MKAGYSIKCELEDAIYEVITEMSNQVWRNRGISKTLAMDMYDEIYRTLHLGALIQIE